MLNSVRLNVPLGSEKMNEKVNIIGCFVSAASARRQRTKTCEYLDTGLKV